MSQERAGRYPGGGGIWEFDGGGFHVARPGIN